MRRRSTYDDVDGIVQAFFVLIDFVHEVFRESQVEAPAVDCVALQHRREHHSRLWVKDMDAGLVSGSTATAEKLRVGESR